MKVSIIIPVYNSEKYILRCLKSVSNQTFSGAIECIIVNDATPDASMEIANDYILRTKDSASAVEWIIAEHKENGGLSVARNTGIEKASGEYIFFLDSDDDIAPDCLERLCNLAERYPGVDIVQGNIAVIPPSETIRFNMDKLRGIEYSDNRKWIERMMLTNIPVTAWNKLINRVWFLSNSKGFKTGIVHEDEHWRYQVFDKINSIAFCYDITYNYYLNEGSIVNSRNYGKSLISMLSIYKEFYPKFNDNRIFLHILDVLGYYIKKIDRQEERQLYVKELKNFIEKIISEKKLSGKVRAVYKNYLKRDAKSLIWLRLMHKSTYKLYNRLLTDGRSPLEHPK